MWVLLVIWKYKLDNPPKCRGLKLVMQNLKRSLQLSNCVSNCDEEFKIVKMCDFLLTISKVHHNKWFRPWFRFVVKIASASMRVWYIYNSLRNPMDSHWFKNALLESSAMSVFHKMMKFCLVYICSAQKSPASAEFFFLTDWRHIKT